MAYSPEPESIEGIVGTLIYRNEGNGFTVLELECGDDLVVATVNAPLLGEGERIQLSGEWTIHKDYGHQFKASSCKLLPPENAEQMERFLSSELIHGVGPSTAHSIVQKFGDETAYVMEHEPRRLLEISGIGQKSVMKIAESYHQNMHMRMVISGLTGYGISVSQAMRIANEYGDEAVELVAENPYRLAEDIFGIGFKTADSIAQGMGIEGDSPFRIAAALKHYMQWAGSEGHTCVPSDHLVNETAKGIGVDIELVRHEAARLITGGELILEGTEPEMVYLRNFHHAEQESARQLGQIIQFGAPPLQQDVQKCIDLQEGSTEIHLAEKQLEAVQSAATDSALVISGGPGTGKTTIVQFLISIFDMSGIDYALCAPTGRAAKRLSEATGKEARTIHRLLEYSIDEETGNLSFKRNDERPLNEKAIIVDEMSMVDIFLFMQLMRATRTGTRLIMIGDPNQLPSVGPGNVLHDIIASGVVKNIELNTVYRQGEGSAISSNAHLVNDGSMPLAAPDEFEIVELGGPEDVWNYLSNICKNGNVQVIAPMKKGGAGVIELNGRLQQLCNPPSPTKAECKCMGTVFRTGDKVMQTKNDYRMEWKKDNGTYVENGLGVFNGDMGEIIRIDNAMRELTVRFDDDRIAVYEFAQADELDRSYAITVHKSQGSEFEEVAIPILNGPPMLYTRNLLYTAITRAKKRVWLLGRKYAISSMIANDKTKERYTGLQQALRDNYHAPI